MEGIAYSCKTLATDLSEGGVFNACLYLVGSPEEELQLWQRLLFGPGLDLSTPLAGIVFFVISLLVAESAAGQCSGCHRRSLGAGVVFTIKCSHWAELYIQ